ncbi:MAG: phenylalanine--tRNA ligase subunit beta [Chloroflexi bacterium]|nr:phenylalanine--tRNA ligase subunit beta [Chloroflexota bacterium]
MKVPLSWLKEYVDVALPARELAHRLTMAGSEVGGITTIGGSWENVYVGHVVGVTPHPNADRLRLATVDIGSEAVTVVCGAPNVAAGQRVPFAKVGARLVNPESGELFTLKAAKIRGVTSTGMVCSERELGVGQDHTGIVVLPADAPIGRPLASYWGDAVLDLEVTPNRPDCLSVLGVAREVAALTGATVREPSLSYQEDGPPIQDLATIRVEAPDLAPRYTASLVTGIKVGPSPGWLQERLLRAGLRPINNLVDITNYVMLEYGQPLHAFDYEKLAERTVLVRRARPGEVLVTLDGQERRLESPMLVIADARRAVGLAGVMGGANTEITESTTAVLLESANFNPISIRRTASALKLHSDAVARFDKGLHPALAELGLRRATRLVLELAGGTACRGIWDVYPSPWPERTVALSRKRVHQVLGVELPVEQVASVLGCLGFHCQQQGDALAVTVPYWRADISIPDDLVEEIARVSGYETIPAEPLSGRVPSRQPQPLREVRERVRDLLASGGMQEVISYSLVSQALLDKVGASGEGSQPPLRLANPMSAEQEHLRTTLRGSVLAALASNERQATEGLRLFEVGRVYLAGQPGQLPHEKEMVVGAFCGPRGALAWHGENGTLDFFDAKGVVEALGQQLGVPVGFQRHGAPLFHPGRCASVMAGATPVGVVGELHPTALARFDIVAPTVALFELDMEALAEVLPAVSRRYQPLPRFPGSVRDMALVLDTNVPAERVTSIILGHTLVVGASLFDVYAGPPIPGGKRSLAYRISFQSAQSTLTAEQVSEAQQEILERLQTETGATLRG